MLVIIYICLGLLVVWAMDVQAAVEAEVEKIEAEVNVSGHSCGKTGQNVLIFFGLAAQTCWWPYYAVRAVIIFLSVIITRASRY